MKKKLISIVMSMLLLLIAMMPFSITASAATSGNSKRTQVINVTTQNPWWFTQTPCIELKQDKSTYYYQNFNVWKWKWEQKTGSIYPTWIVTVKNLNNNKIQKYTWTSNWIQIKMDKNARYQITVAPDSNSTWLRSNAKSGNWKITPNWWVNKTWHLGLVY